MRQMCILKSNFKIPQGSMPPGPPLCTHTFGARYIFYYYSFRRAEKLFNFWEGGRKFSRPTSSKAFVPLMTALKHF